ncbi:MAG: Gfo/Idh/MocA family oxidoreductase [candidate division KSB1 bacterium]|nr:Gfo/Idh/MocA family oxidoreductase [candidate division KSB1 bacterium]
MRRGMTRREFLRHSAATGMFVSLGPRLVQPQGTKKTGPNDAITVGMIGVGARGQELMEAVMKVPGTEIVAVCDAYKGRVRRAIDRTQGRAKDYGDYRNILADKGIDVVVIATPDHWHARQAIEALEAGKDVYIEKPLTYTVDEGVEIVHAVRRTGRILQVGSQGMSSAIQEKAREIVASGKLGQITMIRAYYNRNTASGAWIYPIPPDASPETVDWEMFLGPAPKRPFSLERFFRWRCYWDYSGGIPTDLFVHLCTSIHFVMGAKMARSAMAMGALYRWRESREVPDTVNAVLEYPEGFMVNMSTTFNNQRLGGSGFQILGTEGSLEVGGGELRFYPEIVHEDNGWIVRSWPKELEEAYYRDPKVLAAERPDTQPPRVLEAAEIYREEGLDATLVHMQRFFESVRTRKPPVQDALMGHRAAACAHMVNLSIRSGKIVYWDFDRETVKKA